MYLPADVGLNHHMLANAGCQGIGKKPLTARYGDQATGVKLIIY